MAYFPNGSSGEVLDEQCANCPLGYGWNDPKQGELFDAERIPKPCPVAFVQLEFNYKQCDDGNKDLRRAMNVLISDDGECQVRKQLLGVSAGGFCLMLWFWEWYWHGVPGGLP